MTTSTASLLGRHLGTDRAAGAAVAVIVLAAAFLGAAVPRALDDLATDGLRGTIDEAATLDRDLLSVSSGQPPVASAGTDDPTLPFRRLLDEVEAALEPRLAASSLGVVGTFRYRDLRALEISPVLPDETDTSLFNPTVLTDPTDDADPGFATRVRYVAGEPPRSAEVVRRPGSPVPPTEPGGPTEGTTTVEVAVSAEAARVHGLQPGSVITMDQGLVAVVTGVVEPLDATDPYWQLDDTLLDPAQSYTDSDGIIHTTALLVAPEAAAALAGQLVGTNLPQVQVRVPLAAGGIRADQATELFEEVRRMEGRVFVLPSSFGPGAGVFVPAPEVRLTGGLDGLVLEHLRQRRTSAAVVALVAAGLLGVTLAVLTLAARLVVERRRRALALVVARGGSGRQVVVVAVLEGALLGLPAAAIGAVAAARVVEGEPGAAGWVLPLLLGLAPVVLLPVLAVLGTRDGGAQGLRGRRRDGATGLAVLRSGPGRRRLVAEGVLVVAAVAAVVSLRQRGLDPADLPADGAVSPAALQTSPDPLLAAAPLLVGLVTAVLVARFAPAPLRWLAARAARRRGAVTFLGAARAGRDQVAGTLPVLVVLLAISTCVLGVVVSGTSQRGLRTASWEQVGAQARTTALGLTAEELAAGAAVPGVDALAAVSVSRGEVEAATREGAVEVFAADPATLATVQADVPGAAPLPPELGWSGSGPVPLLVSSRVAAVGEEVTLTSAGSAVDAVVVGTAERLVSLSGAGEWVLADPLALEAAGVRSPLPRIALVDLGAGLGEARGEQLAEVEEGLRLALDTGSPLRTRADAEEAIAQRPLVGGTLGSFGYAAAVSAVLCALALLLTLVAAAAERGRLLSRLRTLGLDGRQSGVLVAWEAAPVVLPGVLVGLVAGFGVTVAVYPALDLRSFTGGRDRPELAVDLGLLVWSVGGVLVASALAVLLAVLTGSRARLGEVLRVGDET